MKTIDWAACERLIGSLAPKFLQAGFDLDDLKQEARLAVLESHGDYSPDTGVSMNTFIGRRIRDALRTFVSANVDAVEVSREWVAESIADGPDASLRAKTKAECELLRAVVGADRFKKPRRHIEKIRAASFDDDADGDGEEALTLHERVGVGPEQELGMLAAEMTTKVSTKMGRKGGELAEIFRLRSEGHTFEQIGQILGKDWNAVYKAFSRAQKRLNNRKKAA